MKKSLIQVAYGVTNASMGSQASSAQVLITYFGGIQSTKYPNYVFFFNILQIEKYFFPTYYK